MSEDTTVYLHIGTPKSGTTYVQSRISRSRAKAAEQGLLWPGPGWSAHVKAARSLHQLSRGQSVPANGPWSKLVNQIREWDGPAALISIEWMIDLEPHQIRAAVESLAPARVEVIITARDLVRSFIAQAQEMSKNYRPWPWAQIATEILEDDADGPAYQRFWEQQDLTRIARDWLACVPADRIHLVTIPPSGSDPDALWDRFCSVLGIDGAGFKEARSANVSLGATSTVLMQRLNAVAADRRMPKQTYKVALHHQIANEILAPNRGNEEAIAIGPELDAHLRARSRAMVEDLRATGINLVGSWGDLEPGPPARGRRPEEITDSELLELCLSALVTLAERAQEQRQTAAGATGDQAKAAPAKAGSALDRVRRWTGRA